MSYATLARSYRKVRELSRPIITDDQLKQYRRLLGPMPEYARLETINRAISATSLSMQTTTCAESYDQDVRIMRTLRDLHRRLSDAP